MFQSRYCLSDVDVRLSQAHVLFSEINQMMSKCPEPVQSRKLLPRLDVILSEISSLVALSQDCINDVDGDDSYDCPDGSLSLDWDDYNYNSINYYDLQNYDDLNNNLSLSASGQSYAEDCFHDEDEDAGGNDIHGDTGGNDNHVDVKHDCHEDVMEVESEDDGENGNIADRVMQRRRSPNLRPTSSTTSGGDYTISSAPAVSTPKQAIKFIDKILMFISRIAPNDKFSMSKSRSRRRRKIIKYIHPELRFVFKNSHDLLSPAPESLVPGKPPLPVVDWTKVNTRGLGNLPTPQMFPKLGCSEDPNIYADRIRDHGAHGRISSGSIHAKERFPFGGEFGLMTDQGVISTNKGEHMEDPYMNIVHGHVWSRDLHQWVIHAKPSQADNTNKKNGVKKQKGAIFPKKSRRRELR